MPPPRSSVPQSARAAVVGISVALFVVGLFLPALEFHSVNNAILSTNPNVDPTLDVWKGATALFTGFFGIVDWDMAGYANPLLWIAWIYLLLDRIRSAAKWAIAAAVVSLLTFRLFTVPIPVDEGSVKHEILTHLLVGAWLWFASILLPLAASLLWWNRQTPQLPTLPPGYSTYPTAPPPRAYPPPPPSAPPPPNPHQS